MGNLSKQCSRNHQNTRSFRALKTEARTSERGRFRDEQLEPVLAGKSRTPPVRQVSCSARSSSVVSRRRTQREKAQPVAAPWL